MNKKFSLLLLALVIGLCVFMYFDKESGHERELKKLIETHTFKMDSANRKAESWRLLALEYGNQFRREAMRANKAEERYNYLREQNEIDKKKPVIRYSDIALDSMFRARYGTR